MPTTRRRSARLASSNATSIPKRSLASYAVSKLSSLLERDETSKTQRNNNVVFESPVPKSTHKVPGAFENEDSYLQTPQKASELFPELGEMHPGKVHRSTTKEADSGLRLGFADIQEADKFSVKAVNSTPSKSALPVATAGFDFKWSRPETDLSSEAQRIMESVREEAAKIKEKMQLERDEQLRKDEDGDSFTGMPGRKFATPRRKTGRFSDAHKAEFQKMDSISNHVSAWKTKMQSTQTGLKRTKSRAELDIDLSSARLVDDSRPTEGSSPAKRMRLHKEDDVSIVRPSHNHELTENPSRLPRGLPAAATTPTKSSLARASSVKSMKTTRIPGLNRSKSTVKLDIPVAPRTEGSNKYFSALARAGSMKSILHKPQPKFSDDPVKIAAGTHIPTPKRDPNINKILPSLPGNPYPLLNPSPSLKRVGFRFSSKESVGNPIIGSPSPSPSPAKAAGMPTKSQKESSPIAKQDAVTYPKLKTTGAGPLTSHPPTPGAFTFRSTKPVNFGPSSSGLTSPTIRRVRPSGIATPVAAVPDLPAVPHGMPNKKRRRADDDDEGNMRDIENRAPGQGPNGESPAKKMKPSELKKEDTSKIGAAARRRLGVVANKVKGVGSSKEKEKEKGKKPGVLSLSRLNMLARPKNRA